jgi:thioredoxin reductase (NADPH)
MIEPEELKQVPIFACLPDAQRVRIAQSAAELHVHEGEWLIREGEAPWFFILLEGALAVEKEYGGSSEVRGRYQPGDFFGETPILLDSPAIASLRASEPSRVMRLDRMQFKELIDSSPECSSLIAQVMAKRVSMIREYVRDNNPVRVLVVGSQYDNECREIRTFLSLNRIPYQWADRNREPDRIPACLNPEMAGPFVVIDQSKCVGEPLTVRKVAVALGIQTIPTKEQYDVVIVGGGPAGLAAAVYGASEGLSVLLVEKNATGGQAGSSSRIENYLGSLDDVSGTLAGKVGGPSIANLLSHRLGYWVDPGEPYYTQGCTTKCAVRVPGAAIPQRAWSAPANHLLLYIPLPNVGRSDFSTSGQVERTRDNRGSFRFDSSSTLLGGSRRVALVRAWHRRDL